MGSRSAGFRKSRPNYGKTRPYLMTFCTNTFALQFFAPAFAFLQPPCVFSRSSRGQYASQNSFSEHYVYLNGHLSCEVTAKTCQKTNLHGCSAIPMRPLQAILGLVLRLAGCYYPIRLARGMLLLFMSSASTVQTLERKFQ